ncbi:LIC12162 family transferase [Leptospira santarosai]|uniref:LIC12162 family transferase n=1 Tax=Leptospira santarosai TaxID=28183 RepID=UPI0024AFA309|nr:LIC12162 family protein [Leptospira santarosai]MDI7174384.1 LIC12162 family protein [Leptospira santarosai]MDI7193717.1 LIC12162 family protein [Leptospira santarosai]MDO6398436.1 LIC12162 family protein [Leptospira santarosai]MDO6403556.1 LIC12162 family protein [Leptospira santarosai]
MKENSRLLVLTGHPELWPKTEDEEKSALYLGPWCFTRNRYRKFFEQSNFEMLPSSYKDWGDIKVHWSYISKLHDRVIESLSKYLNDFCGLQESEKFWKIRVSYWLVHWLCCYYDRYLSIKSIKKEGPLTVSIVITDRKVDFRPQNCEDAIEKLIEHEYNLIIYSELLEYLKLPQIFLKNEKLNFVFAKRKQKQNLKTIIHYFLHYQFFLMFFNVFFGECKGFSWFSKLRLSFTSFSIKRLFVFIRERLRKRKITFNTIKEYSFPQYFLAENEFEACLSENILNHIPIQIFTNQPSFPMGGFWIGFDVHNSKKADLISKYASGKNGKWCSVQHGGGYDQYLVFPHEKIEYESSDGFISWGWSNKSSNKIMPLPSPYFVNLLKNYKDNNKQKNEILYISTEHFAYYVRFHSTLRSDSQLSYLKEQANFISHVSSELKSNLIFRTSILFGWNNIEFLQANAFLPKISQDESLISRMRNAKVVVIDHLATSYIECIALNIPTILYFKEDFFGYSDKLKPYLMNLKDAGIYHESSDFAVRFLNENYNQIENWWNSSKVQAARQNFLAEYGKIDKNWFSHWKQLVRL